MLRGDDLRDTVPSATGLHRTRRRCNTSTMTSWRAESFDLLPQSIESRWSTFGSWPEQAYFSNLVGVRVEELRRDYARMSLPWRAELNQPSGLMHGGAIATLIDTVVVPAIGTAYDDPRPFSTIELSVRYLAPVHQEDLVAEGWVTRRGRSVVFCEVEVRTVSAVKVATGNSIYVVGRAPSDGDRAQD